MKRAIVCVATTPHYQRGMARLVHVAGEMGHSVMTWSKEPADGPKHADVPYAFKAYALQHAAEHADILLWADACILPIRSMEPLWRRIETDGFWFCNNGYSNYEWTADSAYPDLFSGDRMQAAASHHEVCEHPATCPVTGAGPMSEREELVLRGFNRNIKHVVATTFGLNVRHPKGAAFLREYFRLASTTRAFCGPWGNTAWTEADGSKPYSDPKNSRYGLCGPADVRGHRHDQTAASVIAWRLGMELTDPPAPFSYARFNAQGNYNPADQDERTILIAHGKY